MGKNEKPTNTNSKGSSPVTPKTISTRSTSKGNSKSHPQLHQEDNTATPSSLGRSHSAISTDCIELLERRLMKSFAQLLNDRFGEFEDQMRQSVDRAIVDMSLGVQRLREELNDVRSELSEARKELENFRRGHRMTDAVITGVPYTEKEDTHKLLVRISDSIGHKLSAYSMAFRSKNMSGTFSHGNKRKHPPIIVKFPSVVEQQSFLRTFRQAGKSGKISLRKISSAFVSDSRIFVNESLTQSTQQILRKAVVLKSNKKCHSVFTRQGVVHVKLNSDDAPIMVPNMDTLDQLIAEEGTEVA